MADLGQNFDDNSPKMGGGGFPLDEGEHPFIILTEEIKEAKSNPANKYLQYNCVVDDGPQKGADFTIILNFWNSNPIAVKIAGEEFNTLRMAAQVPGTNDSAALLQKRAVAVVKKKTKGKSIGEIYIADYSPVAGAVTQAASTPPATNNVAPPTTTAPPATSAQAAAPWHK